MKRRRSAEVEPQVDLFAPELVALPEPEETPEEKLRRRYDLLGRAFELECRAAEAKSDGHRKRLLAKVQDLDAEAATIVVDDAPLVMPAWLRDGAR